MNTIIVKNIISLKVVFVLTAAIYLIAFAFMTLTGGPMSGIPAFFSVLVYIAALDSEDRNGWKRYCSALPVGRKKAVDAHYLSFGLFFTILLFFGVILMITGSMKNGSFTMVGLVTFCAVSVFAGAIAAAILIPLFLICGAKFSSKLIYPIIFLLIFLNEYVKDPASRAAAHHSYFLLLFAVPMAVFALSWLIARTAYEKCDV